MSKPEVTAIMLEAGIDKLSEFNLIEDGADEIVREVYRSMQAARQREIDQVFAETA